MRKLFLVVVMIGCDIYNPPNNHHYEITGEILIEDTVNIGQNEGEIFYKFHYDNVYYDGEILLDAIQEGPPGPIRYDTLLFLHVSGEGNILFNFNVDTYAVLVKFNLKELTKGLLLDSCSSIVRR